MRKDSRFKDGEMVYRAALLDSESYDIDNLFGDVVGYFIDRYGGIGEEAVSISDQFTLFFDEEDGCEIKLYLQASDRALLMYGEENVEESSDLEEWGRNLEPLLERNGLSNLGDSEDEGFENMDIVFPILEAGS